MAAWWISLVAMCVCSAGAFVPDSAAPQSFDEKLKAVGLEFATLVQPDATRQALQDLVDAFNGGQAGAPMSSTGGAARLSLADVPLADARPEGARVRWAPLPAAGAAAFYVDANSGADSNSGAVDAPFRTVARGVAAARGGGTVVLRAGTFYMGAAGLGTISLTSADSGLTVMAYPNETVWVSGAAQLNLTWAPFRVNASTGENVWVASTAGAGVAPFSGLRDSGRRLIRSRFPNTDPELGMGPQFFPATENWMPPAWCANGVCKNPPARFEPAWPSRANESRSGTLYTLGVGGDGCSLFTPPVGFSESLKSHAHTPHRIA
jgi:hypothetical protein